MAAVNLDAEQRGQVWASTLGNQSTRFSTLALADAGGSDPYFIATATQEVIQQDRVDSSGGFRISEAQHRFDMSGVTIESGFIERADCRIWLSSANSATIVLKAATWNAGTVPTTWSVPTSSVEYARQVLTASSALYTISLNQACVDALNVALDSGSKFTLAMFEDYAVDSLSVADGGQRQILTQNVTTKLQMYGASSALALGINF